MRHALILLISVLVLASLACAASAPTPTSTSTPEPTLTATETPVPTNTRRPSPTPRPTRTPDLAATALAEQLSAEVQEYYENGYLATTDGQFELLEDFSFDWAQLGWYRPFLFATEIGDFFLSAHFKWDSAFKNSDVSGCGFIFGVQSNNDHYAVFLDRQQVLFLITDNRVGYSKPVSPTRGTARVKFDYPAEADFTLIVRDIHAVVLVDGEFAGEYTLAMSRSSKGDVGVTVLSGTNRDYGTHCEMTNLRFWVPED